MMEEKIREQIKVIRREAAWVHGMTYLYGADTEKILRDAADTIEELFSKSESTTADNKVSHAGNFKKIVDTLRMMQCKYAEIRKNDDEFDALEDAISAITKLARFEEFQKRVGSVCYGIYMDCDSDYKPSNCRDHEGGCDNCPHRHPVIIARNLYWSSFPDVESGNVFFTKEEAEVERRKMYE